MPSTVRKTSAKFIISYAETSAAFLLALGTMIGASSALAEEVGSGIDIKFPAPVSAPVAPEAVDSAVSQIIDVVKVWTFNENKRASMWRPLARHA